VSDFDAVIRENDELRREVRDLRGRVTAFESSRWWRLHPRALLGRQRRGAPDSPATAESGVVRLPVDFDETDVELYRRVASHTMTTPPRIYALARAVEYIERRGIEGAIVECGVWRGGSMMAVALTLLRLGVTNRELYLFDTFSGMTEPTAEDVTYSGETAAALLADAEKDANVWAIASLDDVRDAMLSVGYAAERVHFVRGRVEETLPERAPDRIALLRLDTDWYASTKHELVHLWPRLAHEGVLILDDYGYWQGARHAVDEYTEEHGLALLLSRIDHTARIAVKL
jgi:O-methyltransferase